MKRLAFITNIILFSLTFAQNTSYKFDYYDISNGLSQNRAQAIFQANDGYIYVGIKEGLTGLMDMISSIIVTTLLIQHCSIWMGECYWSIISQNIWVGTQQKTLDISNRMGAGRESKFKGMKALIKILDHGGGV